MCTLKFHVYIVFLQDDEINLQCQLVEKLKQQMLDQDEVRKKLTHTNRNTMKITVSSVFIFLLIYSFVPLLSSAPGLLQGRRGQGPGGARSAPGGE